MVMGMGEREGDEGLAVGAEEEGSGGDGGSGGSGLGKRGGRGFVTTCADLATPLEVLVGVLEREPSVLNAVRDLKVLDACELVVMPFDKLHDLLDGLGCNLGGVWLSGMVGVSQCVRGAAQLCSHGTMDLHFAGE